MSSLYKVRGHFNPGLSTPDFSTPWFKNSWLKNPGLKSSWLKSLGLKGLGLKLGVEMSFNHKILPDFKQTLAKLNSVKQS